MVPNPTLVGFCWFRHVLLNRIEGTMSATSETLKHFPNLPPEAVVRLPVVTALLGVSAPTVWRWSKSGRLPAPVKRGGVTAWRVGDLRNAMAQAE